LHLFSDDVFTCVRAGQTVTHERSTNSKPPSISSSSRSLSEDYRNFVSCRLLQKQQIDQQHQACVEEWLCFNHKDYKKARSIPWCSCSSSSKHVVSAVHPSVNELQWLDGQFWGLCSGMTVTHFPLYVNIMVHKFSLCFWIIPHSFLYESVSQWNTFITWWRRSTEPSENKCLAWSTEASLSHTVLILWEEIKWDQADWITGNHVLPTA